MKNQFQAGFGLSNHEKVAVSKLHAGLLNYIG